MTVAVIVVMTSYNFLFQTTGRSALDNVCLSSDAITLTVSSPKIKSKFCLFVV